MWFKRKIKNRRLGREQVLDVKLRFSKMRAARTRATAVSIGAVFAIVFGLYMVYRGSEWGLNRLVYENKAFAIQEFDLQTDGAVAVDQLRRWAGVKPEANLLALDLARVKRDLEMMPVVQSASVERVLPHTLRVRITEREPIAQVNVPRPRAGGGFELGICYLDANGWVMLPLEPRERDAAFKEPTDPLPVISGINLATLQPGRRLVAPQVQAALQFLVAFEQSPMAGLVDLKKVDVASPEVLIVTTAQSGEVTFGLTDFERQLRRWQVVFEHGQRNNTTVATLDLAVSNNVPLRWVEASAVSPTTTKPLKILRPKKKHV